MHELFIGVLIVAIVAIQIYVSWDTLRKITEFRSIIPSADRFETVKVYIPESQIKNINVSEILDNVNKYKSPLGEHFHEIIPNEAPTILEIDDEEEYQEIPKSPIVDEFDDDPHALIWISKGAEEKRVEYRLLKSFELLGWNRID